MAGSWCTYPAFYRRLAPKAYTALANWLRTNTLESVGLDIPTQAEITTRELIAGNLQEMERLVRAKRYRDKVGKAPALQNE